MLLNKFNFLPRLFVAPKRTAHAATKGVFIDTAKNCTVATDRYSMLMVEAPKGAAAADFPIIQGYEIEAEGKSASHIMPANAAAQIAGNLQKIKNVSLPILTHAAPLKMDAENIAGFATTTLEQSEPVIYQKIDDTYPEYAKVIPGEKSPEAVVTLDPRRLEVMAKAFKLAGVTAVKIEFYGDLMPVKFMATTNGSQQVTGIIMPIKD